MSTGIEQVQKLQDQVHELIRRYRNTVSELDDATATLNELHEANQANQKALKAAQSQMEEMKLLLAFGGAPESRQEFKAQLSAWIREINTCISKLNA